MIEPFFTENHAEGTYTASTSCQMGCGHVTTATVEGYDLFRYRQGAFVQDAFPYLSAATREALFVSGVCAVCWHNMFGDDED